MNKAEIVSQLTEERKMHLQDVVSELQIEVEELKNSLNTAKVVEIKMIVIKILEYIGILELARDFDETAIRKLIFEEDIQ